MNNEFTIFGNITIKNCKFHYYKNLILIDGVDINKILISNKVSSSKKNYKCFIYHKNDDYKIKPLYIILPQIKGRTRSFDLTKCMYFLIEDDELLEKYNQIWDKVSINIKK